jgi:hypothetical protein
VHGVPLDVHAEDLAGLLGGLVGGPGELHAARLAATTGLDLRLHHHDAGCAVGTEQRDCRGARLLGGGGDDPAQHGDPVPLEHVSCLVLEQVHLLRSFRRPAPGMAALPARW